MAKAILSGILAGSSAYTMFYIQPAEKPYAFAACAFGLCHGLLGLIDGLMGEDGSCSKAKEVSTAIMEIAPLPLVNIELYLASEASSSLALGHGLFLVPLTFDLLVKFLSDGGGDENNTETLKNLTILGNCVSLLFLAVNESNNLYGGMAFVAFFAKYGAMLIESKSEGNGEPTTTLCQAIFFYLTKLAVAADSK